MPATGMMDESSFEQGLTKLEYAAIHIHAGNLSRSHHATVDTAISEASALFDELEKQND